MTKTDVDKIFDEMDKAKFKNRKMRSDEVEDDGEIRRPKRKIL